MVGVDSRQGLVATVQPDLKLGSSGLKHDSCIYRVYCSLKAFGKYVHRLRPRRIR